MKLRRLVSLREETGNILNQYADVFQIHSLETNGALRQMLEKSTFTENRETLLIAAAEDTIRLGKEYGIATLGYSKPCKQTTEQSEDQFLSGVEYLVEGFQEVDASFLEKVYQRHHHIPWTIAKTKRCTIRELCMEDMDGLFALYGDKELTKYTEPLLEYEEELNKQRGYINHMYRYFGYGMWLVFLEDTGELIGRAGLEHRELHRRCESCSEHKTGMKPWDQNDTKSDTVIELGYLIKRDYHHQGFATEVCQAILKYAEEELEIQELNCFIEEGNTPSIKLAETLGFSYMETIVEQNRKMLRFIRKSPIIKH